MHLRELQYDSAAMPVRNGDGMNNGVHAPKILLMPYISFFSEIAPQCGSTGLGLPGDGIPSGA
jgi:hypothetical protein